MARRTRSQESVTYSLSLEAVRNMGTYKLASKGSGKSRFLGRWLVKGDVLQGVPGLVIDPAGGTIDNLLDSLLRLPPAVQQEVWSRVVYVDMGHNDAVMPFPLYYAGHAGDTSFAMASRYLDVVRMLDPHLQTASVEGWNALYQCGMHFGAALSALGAQVSEAPELLLNPQVFQPQLAALCEAGVIERAALDYVTRELPGMKAEYRQRRTASFMQKVAVFGMSRPLKAMFAASAPGINWQQVVDSGTTVLVDLRHVHDAEMQRFKLLWVLQHFLQFVKQRGIGRHAPVALTIDEVSVLTKLDGQTLEQPFARLLDDLLNVHARQGQVWVTVSHQEAWQVSELLLKTFMGCGTRIVGRTSDPASAQLLAEQLLSPDPHRIKRRDPTYSSQGQLLYARPVTYPLDEQRVLAADLLLGLGRFRFFVKQVNGEGGADKPLAVFNMNELDANVYPDDVALAEVRERLHWQSARPVEQVLAEIEQRRAMLTAEVIQVKQPVASAIVASNQYDSEGYKVE